MGTWFLFASRLDILKAKEKGKALSCFLCVKCSDTFTLYRPLKVVLKFNENINDKKVKGLLAYILKWAFMVWRIHSLVMHTHVVVHYGKCLIDFCVSFLTSDCFTIYCNMCLYLWAANVTEHLSNIICSVLWFYCLLWFHTNDCVCIQIIC